VVRRRVVVGLVAVASGAAAWLIPAPAPTAQGPCKAQVERRGDTGTWTRIGSPAYPSGPQSTVAHAVDPGDETWFITNGRVVMRSTDGGCTFAQVFELDEVGAATSRIDAMSAAGVLALNIAAPSADGSRPQAGASMVVVSQDGGETFGDPQPLAGGGEPGPIAVARANPSVIYATAGKVLHRSTDAGTTFEPVLSAVAADPVGVAQPELAIDPADEERVYVRTDTGMVATDDGGQTWSKPVQTAAAGGPAAGQDVTGRPGRVVLTTAADDGQVGGYLESLDGGGSFDPVGEDRYGDIQGLPISSGGGGLGGDDILITTAGIQDGPDPGVYRWFPELRRFVNFDEFNVTSGGGLRGVTTDLEGCTAYMFRDDRLVSWELPRDRNGCRLTQPPPPPKFEFFDAPPPPKAREARLKPADGDITIPVGGSTSVKFTLELPAQPTRLDSFFLLDTSGSTGPYIDGLKVGVSRLVRELLRGFTDANFGLGEYQDISGNVTEEDDTSGFECIRYRRLYDIAPPTKLFQEKLAGITTCGGSEAGYMAAHQVATGAGILEPTSGRKVRPGGNANWREDTLRVLFHVADEPFSRDPSSVPAPEVIKALKDRNIKVIGFDMSCSVGTGAGVTVNNSSVSPNCPADGTVSPGYPDCTQRPRESTQETPGILYCELWEMALETQTFAPRGGVDCNGDGTADVKEGEPMVCRISGESSGGFVEMAEPIRELLLAIPDIQTAGLELDAPAQIGVDIKALDEVDVDVHGDHDLEFTVTLSCT
jgi:hypothetical protein